LARHDAVLRRGRRSRAEELSRGEIVTVIIGAGLKLWGLTSEASEPRLVMVLSGLDTIGYIVMLADALLGGLLVVPRSSREWFAK
jgi:hypothetical protein